MVLEWFSFLSDSITALVVNDVDRQCRLASYRFVLPIPNKDKCEVFFMSFTLTRVTLFHTCVSGQPQHRFWHWFSAGPNHRKHVDHCLLLWVLGKQRSLQELLHSLRWRFWNIVGWLEARSPRGSRHECLWVVYTLVWFISIVLKKQTTYSIENRTLFWEAHIK